MKISESIKSWLGLGAEKRNYPDLVVQGLLAGADGPTATAALTAAQEAAA